MLTSSNRGKLCVEVKGKKSQVFQINFPTSMLFVSYVQSMLDEIMTVQCWIILNEVKRPLV